MNSVYSAGRRVTSRNLVVADDWCVLLWQLLKGEDAIRRAIVSCYFFDIYVCITNSGILYIFNVSKQLGMLPHSSFVTLQKTFSNPRLFPRKEACPQGTFHMESYTAQQTHLQKFTPGNKYKKKESAVRELSHCISNNETRREKKRSINHSMG